MLLGDMASSPSLLSAGLSCIVIAAVLYLILPRSQKEALFRYTPFLYRGRRSSSSKTPPRSLSPVKKEGSGPTSTNYKDAFPPSRREALPTASKGLSTARKAALVGRPVSEGEFRKNLIPFEADYRVCGPSTFTPMEISVAEVKALGDFPDYAELSGVPLPEPYNEFVIEKALPRPYRPFRWAYHQTMALTKLETDWWLELESTYRSRIAQREELFEKYGKLVLDYLPGTELACKEIMEIALQFICARYSQYFSLIKDAEKGYVLHNRLLETETVIKRMHPLHVLLHNVPEDFAIMIRNPEDGLYYFRAGLLCSALGWNVSTKLGMVLKDIHKPIPDYKEKMEFSMDRYFSKMPSARPIQRASWGLEVDTPLFMPPNDPHEEYRLKQAPELTLPRCHLRVDWQTLRRLPLSGSIIFNFKALFTPVQEFRDEKHIPALIEKVLSQGKRKIMEYKNTWHVEHVVRPALRRWAREQGDVDGEGREVWEPRTLDESPWFEGWKEKWHRQQGF
ncbi:hypothetical protein MMC25_001651 [Agyrium rufum]|nr:hypothetical protein [Agyrium rufum]